MDYTSTSLQDYKQAISFHWHTHCHGGYGGKKLCRKIDPAYNGVGDTHRAISNTEKNGEINPNKTETAQPIGEGDTHQAREYANSSNQALHLMKPPSGETGRALSPVRSAIDQSVQMQSKHTIQRKKRLGFAGIKLSGSVPCTFIAPRHEINYAHQYPVSGDKSTPTPGGAETRLVSSAVANEGEGPSP